MAIASNAIVTIILSLQTLYTCLTLTIGQYVFSYFLRTYPNSTNSTMTDLYNSMEFSSPNETNQCVGSQNSSDGDARLWAQEQSADLFFWINLTSTIPVVVMTYILGLYASKLGKRFLVLLPMVGMAIHVTIWLALIYFHIWYIWWFIAAIIVGLSGSNSVLGFTLNLILTENTTDSERSSLFVRLQAMQTGLAAVATFLIGYYIGWRGFADLYWMALIIQIVSIIIVIVYFKSEERSNVDERRSLLSTSTDEVAVVESPKCARFWEVLTIFRSNRRSKKKNLSLLLTLSSSAVSALAVTGFAPFLWLLLSAPFCWSSKGVGNFSAVSSITTAVLSLLGMQLLTYFGAHDAIICAIGQIFFGIGSLWIAFAQHTWQLYIGLLINAFSGYQDSLTTSMVSKWLEPHERNHAFIFMTELNTIVNKFGSALFNGIYSRTAATHRTLTFFIAASLSVVPLVLNICLYVITRTMPNEEISSLSQRDIEPAPLHLPSTLPPRAGVADCMIIPSRSLISELLIGTGEEARADDDDIIGDTTNA